MRQVEVAIEKLANGGAGFGRCDGKAFFVPFTAPGDVARVRITCEKKSYAEGELIELVSSSALRVKPPCPVFGICGGCNWQHVEYSSQIMEKTLIFADLLWRAARISPETVLPLLRAPEPYGYRSRVQLKVNYQGGKTSLGFYRPKSHQVVDIPGHCAITHKSINDTLESLRLLMEGCPDPGNISQIDIARGDDESISVIVNHAGASVAEVSEYLLQHREISDLIGSMFIRHKNSTTSIFGAEHLSYRISGNTLPGGSEKTLFFSKDAFSQINYQQNMQLIRVVSDFAALTGKEKVLDLYCGNGNFSIPLADKAAHVTGFEGYEPSIADARKNAEWNGVTNISFHCSDSAAAVKKLAAARETFDVVVLDPPRNGAAEVMHHIQALNADRIIYVSCDPATLARDLGILKKNGFQVINIQGVDMFPQTYHLESVTLLTKS